MRAPFTAKDRPENTSVKSPLIAPATLYIDPLPDADRPRPISFGQAVCDRVRAISSAVEHFVDIEGVTGSIPVSPTMNSALTGLSPGHEQEPKGAIAAPRRERIEPMKVRNSLRSLKQRHRDCRVVRRKGRVYVINKTQRRFKARQG